MKRSVIVVGAVVAAIGLSLAIAAIVNRSPASPAKSLVYELDGYIWRANIDGTESRRLAEGSSPQISPDGRLVAFIYRAELLNRGLQSCNNLAVKYFCHRKHRLLITSPSGGKAGLVAFFDEGDSSFYWAPDSRHIALLTDHSIRSIDLRTGEKKRLVEMGGIETASFSPDGRSLVFSAVQYGERGESSWEGESDLYVTDLERGAPRTLTRLRDARKPIWGPSAIAFGRKSGIWTVNPDGSNLRQLGENLAGSPSYSDHAGEPVAWSQDGNVLISGKSDAWDIQNEFWTISMPNGGVRFRSFGYPLALSRTGDRALVSLCNLGPGRITIGGASSVSFAGGKPRKVVPSCQVSWNA